MLTFFKAVIGLAAVGLVRSQSPNASSASTWTARPAATVDVHVDTQSMRNLLSVHCSWNKETDRPDATTGSSMIYAATSATKRDFSPNNMYYPLPNRFPDPDPTAILEIQEQGHGILPNSPPPPTLSTEGITNLKLIAFNELFEVAYFTELVYNLTNKVPGYKLGYGHEYVLEALESIVAQEELHLLNAKGALKHHTLARIEQCIVSSDDVFTLSRARSLFWASVLINVFQAELTLYLLVTSLGEEKQRDGKV